MYKRLILLVLLSTVLSTVVWGQCGKFALNPITGAIDCIGSSVGGSLADPGANGVISRTSLNVTAPATATNITAPTYVAGGGSANAQTATFSPSITSLTDGLRVCWKPVAANTTTTPTFAPNGLAAHTIVKAGGTALVASDLTTTAVACAVYNTTGTQWELQNPQTASGGAVSSVFTQTGAVPNLSGDATTSGSSVVSVVKINGITVTGTPSTGYVPTATGSTAATWQAQPGSSGDGTLNVTANCPSVVGNGSTDDTTAMQACLDSVPDFGIMKFPEGKTYKITSTLNFHTRRGAMLLGMSSTVGPPVTTTTAPSFYWGGADGGTVFSIQDCSGCTFQTFNVYSKTGGADTSNTGASILLDVDQSGSPSIIMTDSQFIGLGLYGISHRAVTLIRFSASGGNNVEKMTVTGHSYLSCSNEPVGSAVGIGIDNSFSSNALKHLYFDNSIVSCAIGVKITSGSGDVIHNQLQSNVLSISAGGSFGSNISDNDAENNTQFATLQGPDKVVNNNRIDGANPPSNHGVIDVLANAFATILNNQFGNASANADLYCIGGNSLIATGNSWSSNLTATAAGISRCDQGIFMFANSALNGLSSIFAGPISVRQYGAVGDGSTDDSTAFQNAINAVTTAGGGSICLPQGKTYLINSQLTIPNNGVSTTPQQQNAVTLSPCGDGDGAVWEYNQAGGVTNFTSTAMDLRYTGSGGKIQTLYTGPLKIRGLTLKDGGTPTSYSVGGATLTSVVVAASTATVTFPTQPTCGYYKGAQWGISGSTTASVNATYRVSSVSGSTVLLRAVSAAPGTYNNAGLTATCSSPFIYDTSTTLTIQDNLFFGNNDVSQNAIVLGGMGATIGTASINDGFQGYGTAIVHNVFSRLNSGVLFQTYANNSEVRNNQFIHNAGSGSSGSGTPITWTAAFQCDGSGGAASGIQNNIADNTIEMYDYQYAMLLNGCEDNHVSVFAEDTSGARSIAMYWFDSVSSLSNTFVTHGQTAIPESAGGSSVTSNSYFNAAGAVNTPSGTGPLASLINKPTAVTTLCPASADGVLGGGVMALNTSLNKYVSMCYDEVNDYGLVDAYLFGGGVPEVLRLQPSGARVEIGGALVGASAAPAVSGCGSSIGHGNNLAGTIVTSGTSGSCTVTMTFSNIAGSRGQAPNGWGCAISDMTHPALWAVTAATNTTIAFTGVLVSGDTLQYAGCTGY